ncbi:MAG: homoserine dehydrogenase [Chloroflexi bacterium]|nr:homoserine dehydrogenase [Chloroflexota bacterium]
MPKVHRLCLVGFGNVGQAFARLLLKKAPELAVRYGVSATVTGIITGSHGAAINPEGLNLEAALDVYETGKKLDALSTVDPPEEAQTFIRTCPAEFMFEVTPVDPHRGQPALQTIKTALSAGMHVITANKGPVVHGYQALTELAKQQGLRFMFESAVMDGAPIFSLFRQPLVGANLLGFEGILNSCTNLLLGLMEAGKTFEEALDYGRSIGITETDPSNDVDGWDAAIKVAALVTALMGIPLTPQEVDRTGIRGITPEMLAEAKLAGERWKLVCSAEHSPNGLVARVSPQRVGPESPLYAVNGTSSYCQFKLDVLPGLGILEYNPGPETTAYGLLADFLNILEVQ